MKRGEDFALSERCQNVVRTLSERCQNAVRTARSLSEHLWELHKPGSSDISDAVAVLLYGMQVHNVPYNEGSVTLNVQGRLVT